MGYGTQINRYATIRPFNNEVVQKINYWPKKSYANFKHQGGHCLDVPGY